MNNFFYGVVEDRNDPLQIGRVRVRIHGIHTDNKQYIASADLPWSQVILPTSSAGLSGFGHGHGLVEGSTIFGMFRDDDRQDFVVLGSTMGIIQSGYKEDENGGLVDRSVDAGFNDPRRYTQDEYRKSVDGLDSGTDKGRPNELSLSLEVSPQLPKALEITNTDDEYKVKLTEPDAGDKELPYYPLHDYYDAKKAAGESDLNRFARGGGVYDTRDDLPKGFVPKLDEIYEKEKTKWNEKAGRKSLYPFNKVHHTESGNMIEMDDSVGAERLAVSHRSGTFYEIHKDGTEVHRVVKDNYTVICEDDNVYIGGNCNIKILGDANIDIDGKADIHSDKEMKISSSISTSITAPLVDINGKTVKLNS